MTDHNQNQNQEGQKTIVAFVVGLLIGGLIVWMFVGSPADAPVNTNDDVDQTVNTNDDNEAENVSDSNIEDSDTNTTIEMEIGDGSVSVSDQPASAVVTLDSVTYPMSDGWIGVREYNSDRLGNLLGVVRFSESEGLVPKEVVLQRSTTAGNEYAVVFYTASESNAFNLANNAQVDGIFATFLAE